MSSLCWLNCHLEQSVQILAQCSINNKYIFAFLGLFNVSDKILISFDILLEWRELFRRGCPVLNFIEAKTDLLVMKLNKVDVIYCGIWNDIILESALSVSNFFNVHITPTVLFELINQYL